MKYQIAVLIDGENIPAKDFVRLLAALQPLGMAKTIRVFGDFTNPGHRDWIDICRTYGLEAVLHLPTFSGKNGADMVLAIAAMDILATANFETIVLVSDDSDFVPLARRLSAGGLKVIGAGVKPHQFKMTSAFAQWLCIGERTKPEKSAAVTLKSKPPKKISKSTADVFPSEKFSKVLLEMLKDEALSLSSIGKNMRAAYPEIAASVGKNKLKARIMCDTNFSIDGDKVLRKASKDKGLH